MPEVVKVDELNQNSISASHAHAQTEQEATHNVLIQGSGNTPCSDSFGNKNIGFGSSSVSGVDTGNTSAFASEVNLFQSLPNSTTLKKHETRHLQAHSGYYANQQQFANLPGFWCMSFRHNVMHYDAQTATMLGIEWSAQGMEVNEFFNLFEWMEYEKLKQFCDHHIDQEVDHHELIYSKLKLKAGPMSGTTYHLAISSLLRDPSDDHLLVASGYITYTTHDFFQTNLHERGNDGAWEWDQQTNDIQLSDGYLRMIGYQRHEVPLNTQELLASIVHPDDVISSFINGFRQLRDFDIGDNFECCFRLRHRDGHYFWALCRSAVLGRDKDGKALRIVGITESIEALQNKNEDVLRISWTDTLTALFNRDYLDAHIVTYTKSFYKPLCCVFCDITGLKLINDFLGHDAGDRLVILAATVLKNAHSIPCDIIRYGGDEFVIIIPKCTKVQLELLLLNLAEVCTALGQNSEIPLFMGFGGGTLDETNGDLTKLISLADARAQEQKNKHRKKHYQRLLDYINHKLDKHLTLSNINDERRVDFA